MRLESFGRSAGFGGRKLAVVFALGTIVRGDGGADPWTDETFTGSDDLGQTLRDLREDDSVPAVILRIDSPGGSALASDLILREIELLAAEKPVIVSMSDLAASGGYYIAAKANRIVAEPGTITGSIGVITGRFATSGLEQDLLGVTRDELARGAHAGLWADPRPMDEERAGIVRKMMQPVYDAFVQHVADGRDMSVEEVDAMARGRVWLGRDAQRLGLVDELGGLDRAIALAKEEAGIDPGRGDQPRLLPGAHLLARPVRRGAQAPPPGAAPRTGQTSERTGARAPRAAPPRSPSCPSTSKANNS